MIGAMRDAVRNIRKRLGLTQAELAAKIDVTAGNVGHYETGRQVASPDTAAKLIRFARRHGLKDVSFDTIYGHLLRRTPPARAEPRA
jgi:transcriptional regulator with XRE-family HTH domain